MKGTVVQKSFQLCLNQFSSLLSKRINFYLNKSLIYIPWSLLSEKQLRETIE